MICSVQIKKQVALKARWLVHVSALLLHGDRGLIPACIYSSFLDIKGLMVFCALISFFLLYSYFRCSHLT